MEITYPLSSAYKISLQPSANSKSILKLFKNEIVEGKVLKSLASGNVLLLIKGRSIMAKTCVPLREGRILSLKVEEILPATILRVLGIKFSDSDAIDISIILSAMKENLWKSISQNINHYGLPKEVLSQFRTLMNDLSLRLFLKSTPDLLKALIDKSGLNWESKLKKALIDKPIKGDNLNKLIKGDLKGLVSRFLALKEEKGVLPRRFISTIENIQLLNRLGLEQDRKIFLPIPIQFSDGLFTVGQLLIRLPQREYDKSISQKTDKNIFRLTFLLELSNLGPLRADLTIQRKRIGCRFLLTRKEAKLLLEKSIPIFISKMKERGFSIHNMGCHIKDPETVKQSLIGEIIPEEGNTLSLIA